MIGIRALKKSWIAAPKREPCAQTDNYMNIEGLWWRFPLIYPGWLSQLTRLLET
jgi:hypothetical protein